MITINKLFFLFLVGFVTLNAIAFENLVYTWRGFPNHIAQAKVAAADLQTHAAQINILASQAYHIDEQGVVYGAMDPQMLQIAKAQHIKLMPLVGNVDFDAARTHVFLTDKNAQNRAIQSILQLCQQHHYDGVQIDFEGMNFTDRDAFTNFYQALAKTLHQNNFKIAIAIVPNLTDAAPATAYLKGRYEGWSGVYDYQALADSSDFVTLMTYDQHGNITTPGPVSGTTWIETIVQYALQYIPANKISLGIPWHSNYWYTGKIVSQADDDGVTKNPIQVMEMSLTYPEAMYLIKENNITLRWDDEDKVPYAFFKHNFLYEYIFMENADSFKAKLALVKKYKLRGISNWCLGEEDPKVWDILTKQTAF